VNNPFKAKWHDLRTNFWLFKGASLYLIILRVHITTQISILGLNKVQICPPPVPVISCCTPKGKIFAYFFFFYEVLWLHHCAKHIFLHLQPFKTVYSVTRPMFASNSSNKSDNKSLIIENNDHTLYQGFKMQSSNVIFHILKLYFV